MDVQKGIIIYDNYTNISYGRCLPKQEKRIYQKYERHAWPDEKDMDSRPDVYEQSPKPNVLNQTVAKRKKLDFEYPGEMPGSCKLDKKQRPVSENQCQIQAFKKEVVEKTCMVNMTLEQLHNLLEKKKALQMKLKRYMQNKFNFTTSVKYEPGATMIKPNQNSTKNLYTKLPVRDSKDYLAKGNVLTLWNDIKNKSENAFSLRHKGEDTQKNLAQLNTDAKKLKEKKEYLESIIEREMKKRGNLDNDILEAHVELRTLTRNTMRNSKNLMKQDHQTTAMQGRFFSAQFRQYDINNKADENLRAVKHSEMIRKKALGIQTKENVVH